MGAEAELREPEAGIREFGAELGIAGIYMEVGGACDAANGVAGLWAWLLEVVAGFCGVDRPVLKQWEGSRESD